MLPNNLKRLQALVRRDDSSTSANGINITRETGDSTESSGNPESPSDKKDYMDHGLSDPQKIEIASEFVGEEASQPGTLTLEQGQCFYCARKMTRTL
jgi:hypothetical protein